MYFPFVISSVYRASRLTYFSTHHSGHHSREVREDVRIKFANYWNGVNQYAKMEFFGHYFLLKKVKSCEGYVSFMVLG